MMRSPMIVRGLWVALIFCGAFQLPLAAETSTTPSSSAWRPDSVSAPATRDTPVYANQWEEYWATHEADTGQPSQESIQSYSPQELFERFSPSVVVIRTYDASDLPVSQGSGFLVIESGVLTNLVATNYHVVTGAARISVKIGSRWLAAERTPMFDARDDLALLRIPEQRPGLVIVEALPRVGATVALISSPRGYENTISLGVVSGVRTIGEHSAIQTTASASPGSSGGPIFDEHGQVIGVLTWKIVNGENINFAVPAERLSLLYRTSAVQDLIRRLMSDLARRYPTLDVMKVLDYASDFITDDATLADVERIVWTAAEEIRTGKTRPAPGATLTDAIALIMEGRSEKAIPILERIVATSPDLTEAWHWLGEARRLQQDFAAAVTAYRRALQIQPQDGVIWNDLGITYATLNRQIDAIKAFREAIRIDPDYAKAWYNLGGTYVALNRQTDAAAAYREAIRIDPDFAKAWGNLGTVYYYLNRHTDAIIAYRESIRIDPDYAEAWGNLGLTYGKLGRPIDSRAALEEALRIDPSFVNAWYDLAVHAYLVDNSRLLLQCLEKLDHLDPERAAQLRNRIREDQGKQ